MKLAFVTILLSVFVQNLALGHGMGKPGPNGGYIKMPGIYHVELVSSDAETKVYFLDMEFKKLPVTNAQVSMKLKGAKEFGIKCIKETDAFRCDIKGTELKMYKELTLSTSKNGEKEVASVYQLPLSF